MYDCMHSLNLEHFPESEFWLMIEERAAMRSVPQDAHFATSFMGWLSLSLQHPVVETTVASSVLPLSFSSLISTRFDVLH